MVFVVALVVEGLCTSLMLIAAAPPLVTGWPVARMPGTGFVMNLCVFGAVAAGPTIGGLQASAQEWRSLFWGVALIAAAALAFALLTFEDDPPQDRDAPWDIVAVLLAGPAAPPSFSVPPSSRTQARRRWRLVRWPPAWPCWPRSSSTSTGPGSRLCRSGSSRPRFRPAAS